MEGIHPLIVFLAGVFVRLALPIAVTLTVIQLLRRLDVRWQQEAESQVSIPPVKPECWRTLNCPPGQRSRCPAYSSAQPCWQVFRTPNGYLSEGCLTCRVFLSAPAPAQP